MHQLISFYFAGIDTTGHLVAFALYALAQYPQYKQRIIDDIKANIQDLNAISYENLSVIIFSFRSFSLLPTF
jgi:cytochrome P450